MKRGDIQAASRRERQILDVLHRLGRGSVLEVRGQLPDPPSYSSVRTLLGVMEAKGLVTHAVRGKAYIYSPSSSPVAARRSALRHLIATFFRGSAEDAAIALLEEAGLDPATRKQLGRRIAQAHAEGR